LKFDLVPLERALRRSPFSSSRACRGHHVRYPFPFETLVAAGSLAACRTHGTLKLEGKEYVVQDADVINFRHSG
jgi:ribosome-binding ATPase YchF (GTP1/OBG family)